MFYMRIHIMLSNGRRSRTLDYNRHEIRSQKVIAESNGCVAFVLRKHNLPP